MSAPTYGYNEPLLGVWMVVDHVWALPEGVPVGQNSQESTWAGFSEYVAVYTTAGWLVLCEVHQEVGISGKKRLVPLRRDRLMVVARPRQADESACSPGPSPV